MQFRMLFQFLQIVNYIIWVYEEPQKSQCLKETRICQKRQQLTYRLIFNQLAFSSLVEIKEIQLYELSQSTTKFIYQLQNIKTMIFLNIIQLPIYRFKISQPYLLFYLLYFISQIGFIYIILLNILSMLDSVPQLQSLSNLNKTLLYLVVSIVGYLVYRTIVKGYIFKTFGQYNVKLKNIGRPLPAYPNGWYVAIRSDNLEKGKSEAIDIAGQNIVVFRSLNGKPYALEAYCKHLGANLGIGGKVINQKCIQCPFHGWLYDGQTGQCVDHDGKPMQVCNVEYNKDLGEKGKKLQWVKGQGTTTSLRKYPVCEMNGYVYVWIHAMLQHQNKPIYPMIDFGSIIGKLQYRAATMHQVRCHIQDIPQNGADTYHFKYVHSQIIPKVQVINFLWKAKWKRGDDPNLKQIFQHHAKFARDFKQRLYKQFIQNYPNKQCLSVGYIDNYVKLPFLGHMFSFNVTILQLGCSTVFIFIKSPIFTIVLCHYMMPKQKYRQIVFHDGYTSNWLPYWASALAIKLQGNQVTNDMYIWESKRFGRNVNFKKGEIADDYLKSWRQWYSQFYEGCKQKEKNQVQW